MSTPEPKFEVRVGDALSVLRELPANSVTGLVTDPPYNSGGATSTERTRTARAKYVSTDAKHTLSDFPGDQRDQRSYIRWLSLVFAECWRVTTPGSHALVFTDWRQLPATTDAVQVAGWTWQGVIPWRKKVNRPRRGGFRAECEYLVWCSRGMPHKNQDVFAPGIVTGSQPSGVKRLHITQKPVELLREVMQVCPPGGRILDPFAGSGSTGEAALLEGHEFLGVELTEHYANIARQRLAALCLRDDNSTSNDDSLAPG